MKTQSLFFRSASVWLDTGATGGGGGWGGRVFNYFRHYNRGKKHEVLNRKRQHTCWCEDVWIGEFIEVWSVVDAFDLYGNGSRSLSVEHISEVRRKELDRSPKCKLCDHQQIIWTGCCKPGAKNRSFGWAAKLEVVHNCCSAKCHKLVVPFRRSCIISNQQLSLSGSSCLFL